MTRIVLDLIIRAVRYCDHRTKELKKCHRSFSRQAKNEVHFFAMQTCLATVAPFPDYIASFLLSTEVDILRQIVSNLWEPAQISARVSCFLYICHPSRAVKIRRVCGGIKPITWPRMHPKRHLEPDACFVITSSCLVYLRNNKFKWRCCVFMSPAKNWPTGVAHRANKTPLNWYGRFDIRPSAWLDLLTNASVFGGTTRSVEWNG